MLEISAMQKKKRERIEKNKGDPKNIVQERLCDFKQGDQDNLHTEGDSKQKPEKR